MLLLSSRCSSQVVRRSRSIITLTGAKRCFAMKHNHTRLLEAQDAEVNHPNYTLDAIQEETGDWNVKGPDEPEPHFYERGPVSSAHMIEIEKSGGKLSQLDSVKVSANGTLVHGRYGDLGFLEGIPVEYLALLRPAAEGAAAVRNLPAEKGTVLIYGASHPAGLAATQLAFKKGHAVLALLGNDHSDNDDMQDSLKAWAPEPGTAVPEEFACLKKNFQELLDSVMNGDKCNHVDPQQYLKDFIENVPQYAQAFPNTRPAAVPAEALHFEGQEERYRENYRENLDAYLEQFQQGSPPISKDLLDTSFTLENYQALKPKPNAHMAKVVSGFDPGDFNFGDVVLDMCQKPESAPTNKSPFEFDITNPDLMEMPLEGGGPLKGVIMHPTDDLLAALEVLEKHDCTSSLRKHAEAVAHLSRGQRNAYNAATHVVNIAKQHNVPVQVVGGSIPGQTSVKVQDEDIQTALNAMDVDEHGKANLDLFVEVFRANDFPVYEPYAIFRAGQRIQSCRAYVVTK